MNSKRTLGLKVNVKILYSMNDVAAPFFLT